MSNSDLNRRADLEANSKIRKLGGAVLFPFLLGLYPVLALLSENIQEMRLSDAYRSILVVLGMVCVSMAASRLLLRDWYKAGAWTTLWVVLFFSYGHVYALLKIVAPGGIILGRHRYLIPLWILAFAVGSWWIFRRMRNPRVLTGYLNIIALVAIMLPIANITRHSLYTMQIHRTAPEGTIDTTSALVNYPIESLPDIYYIIPDAYARADILQEFYDHDNAHFMEFLRERGFYVAGESWSNYSLTVLSVTSSLNMSYLSDIEFDIPPWRGTYAFYYPLQHSVLRQELERLGYATVAFATGYGPTEIFDADYVFTPNMTRLEELQAFEAFNPFEGLLIHASAALILTDIDQIRNTPVGQFIEQRQQVEFSNQREMILQNLDALIRSVELESPKFVFFHLIPPHRPYFFGAQGQEVEQHEPFTLDNIEPPKVSLEKEYYRDQLIYVTSRLEQIVEAILANSDHPPIIIIQSDHGPGLGIHWTNPTDEQLRDRMAILNAYYLPQDCHDLLYPSITPVNSFRVMFNCLFPGSFDLLPDRSIFSDRKVEVDFRNFTVVDDRIK